MVVYDCEIDALLKLRADLNAKAPEKGEGVYKLSVNDLVIKALAVALRRVPTANAAWWAIAIINLRCSSVNLFWTPFCWMIRWGVIDVSM